MMSFLIPLSSSPGLDPAQPCFATSNDIERLDASDADFVDIIHTNGRMLKKIGFGMPEAMGKEASNIDTIKGNNVTVIDSRMMILAAFLE